MPETLPLFPLGTVLLPGASLPLHIFEPRYRQLAVDLVTGAVPGRSFGVVAIRQGREVGPGAVEAMRDVGCTARLTEARRLPDGRFEIVARGERRFRLLAVDDAAAPYLVGSVEWMPDTEPGQEDRTLLPALAHVARQSYRRYHAVTWQREDRDEPGADVDPCMLAHLLAADCLLALEDRQALLEERDPAQRLRLVRSLLARETGFLRSLRAVPTPPAQLGTETSRN